MGSTQNRHRVGRPKKLSARAERHIQMISLKDRCRSAVSIAAEIEEVRVSLLVIQPYAALYIKLVCMAVTPGGNLFWKQYTRKPAKSLQQICQQSTWITGTMSYSLMRWRLICLVPMASSMCGGDQVRSTKISMLCLQSSKVVGMSWSGAAWVLQVLRVTSHWGKHELQHVLWNTAAEQDPLSRNWVAGQCSSMTMTTKYTSKATTALLKRLMDSPSMSPDLNSIEHLRGILKRKVEVRKVANIRQIRDIIMEEWKSISVATCEALVNSMPRRVKAVLDNDGGHTKYWQLTWGMLILITFSKWSTHFC